MDNCEENVNENCENPTDNEEAVEVVDEKHEIASAHNSNSGNNNDVDEDNPNKLSSDESMCANSSSDADDEDDENDEIVKQLLKQLLTVNKIKKQEIAKKDKQFIPCIKKFLKYDMQTKSEKLTTRIVKHLTYLARMILNNKISIETDHSERRLLAHLVAGKIPEKDKKVLLIEDYRLHSCFRDAIKVIEEQC